MPAAECADRSGKLDVAKPHGLFPQDGTREHRNPKYQSGADEHSDNAGATGPQAVERKNVSVLSVQIRDGER